MRCPGCKKANKDKVIDSRATERGSVIRRRRECLVCGRRFTTKERVEEEIRVSVVKRDGSREPYVRDKIIHGLRHACYKLPVTDEQINQLVGDVEEDIFRNHDREVTSEQIGEYLVDRLRQLSAVAYVRFVSVYRKYSDVEEFVDEVRNVTHLTETNMPEQGSLFDG